MVLKFLLVALGGGIGSALRYACGLAIPAKVFPWPTLLVNITGSFILGVLGALFIKNTIPENWKLLLAAGFCGGFTTFSAFSMENIVLLQNGKAIIALLYIAASILFGLLAAFAGYKIFN